MPDHVENPNLRPVLGADGNFAREATRVRGTGEKFHPQSLAQARESLLPQIQHIRREIGTLPDRYRGERVIIEATLLPNYLAASSHPAHLRDDAQLVPVGTRPARGNLVHAKSVKENVPTKTLLFAATDESVARLEEIIGAGVPMGELTEDFVKFESFSLPGTGRIVRRRPGQEEIADNDEIVWEAVLHPAVGRFGGISPRNSEEVLAKWEALVSSLDGEIHREFLRRVGSLTFVPIRLKAHDLDEIARFNPLRAIRPMPQIRRLPEKRLRSLSLGGTMSRPPAGGPTGDRRIATFDGGVDTAHPLLAPFVREESLTSAAPDDEDVGHGTLVTSALLYGHLSAGRALTPPPAHVDHFRVFPAPDHVDEEDVPYWVLDRVIETIVANPRKWSVVNLSLGPDERADEDAEISRFTAEIDRIAHDLKIAFTIAAGNDGYAEISTLGDDRVMSPADGVNVLGVGSCHDLHPPQPERAPYSCVGPGRPGLWIQPVGVSFGGSEDQEFVGADIGGGFQSSQGTSFAAPTAARGLATLLEPLTELRVNVARGFAAHFAVPPKEKDLIAVGHGRFLDDYRPVLNCTDGSITVVVRDSIERGATKAFPLPYPTGGVDGKVNARWTISFTSPTDPRDPVEYTLAGLEVSFRPNSAVYALTKGKAIKKVDLRTEGALVQALTNDGWRLSTNPTTRSGKAIKSEQVLRDEGKWETVLRHEDTLLASSLYLPEIWITYFERSEGELVGKQSAKDLDFALLLTVEAARAPDLYEQVRAEPRFKVLSPLAVPVRVPA